MAPVETLVYRLPPAFYDDHVARALPAGVVVKSTARSVWVELDAEAFAELRSDAVYYRDEMTVAGFGPEGFGLVGSARATVKALDKVGPPPALPADELERRRIARELEDAESAERAERALAGIRERQAALVAERDARHALEDAIPARVLLRLENRAGDARDPGYPDVSPADASRILDRRFPR